MTVQDEMAILIVAYGTRDPVAYQTYREIEAAYGNEFPGTAISMAFTSGALRKKMAERMGTAIQSPLTALSELHDRGYRDVAVQSLQVVPGSEFHQVSGLVQALRAIPGRSGFRRLGMGLPLLSGIGDCKEVSSALSSQLDDLSLDGSEISLPRGPDEAVVLMGHGTGHPADSIYCQMASILSEDHSMVFLGTLDGYPGRAEILRQLKHSGAKRIRLMPFLLVAGAHALNDMAGDGSDSWKSAFERDGFEVDVYLQGLCRNRGIVEIFVRHTRDAIEGLTRDKSGEPASRP